MHKQTLLLGTVALIPLLAFAAPAHAQYQQQSTYHQEGTLSPLSGFYAGVYGGYGWTDADIAGGGSADLDGWDTGLFAGYSLDTLLDRTLGLGINGSLEAFYGWSDQSGDGYEKDTEWGLSFRPGLSFVDDYVWGLKPYGIVGYRRADIEGAGTSRWHDGFELGLGTELIAHGDFGVRLDYSHVWYEDKGGVDPDEDNLRLGLAYHF